MAGQKGRDVLIKISDGEVPESFITLAGIRSSEIELNAQLIDATSADSAEGWRELLIGAGVKTARVKGRGVFKDAESDQRMREVFFTDEKPNWQLVIPGLGTFTGSMQISELRWAGEYDGQAEFSIDLQSAGQLQFQEAV